jgi:hypothetical protein
VTAPQRDSKILLNCPPQERLPLSEIEKYY